MLSVVFVCFIVWAGFVNVSKQKKEQEEEQVYAEQQEKKAREAEGSQAGKRKRTTLSPSKYKSEKNKWVIQTGEHKKSHDTDRCAGGGNRNSGFGGVSGRRQNYEGFGGYV